jgi:hypothetical protein
MGFSPRKKSRIEPPSVQQGMRAQCFPKNAYSGSLVNAVSSIIVKVFGRSLEW